MQAVVELSDVAKLYGKVCAVDGLHLHVGRGGVYGFLGRNGAGKSTTLRILMGITKPTRGRVELFGMPISKHAVRARQRIGYVAQEQHFYDWMTPRHLGRFAGAFFPTWRSDLYSTLLDRFDLPQRKIRTFSGGMKARLALALALAHQPELLLLDEPTAGLDAVARREFIDIVRGHAGTGSQTVIFSSHLINEVELIADRVGIIEAGRMRYEGSIAALSRQVKKISCTDRQLAEVVAQFAGLQMLGVREVSDRYEITARASVEGVFEGLKANFSAVSIEPLPLEEIFIAIVMDRQPQVPYLPPAAQTARQ